ncbi:tripartite tricarboxylate transporter substrate binding protein [Geosporobacter ferrireducens]|uniref:ABC transporter substrate-binding protein n=1 Tax=Geosporobacter ferrireducens TaxID=1424294 RepID=A0A1D8GMR3_9FIRM|nr:tripartite tricarboxylate transporter substrate binding protein [Geosporobacter ferrireducens]AOT72122.1 ABC transporter substrate-binding protein [Geosporobacter ferrireducens]MTI56010.1 tripartite tricarboxylate transporter substrate binding protein [Geosporobacter ferrireducens]
MSPAIKKVLSVVLVLALSFALGACGATEKASFPEKTIQVIVPYAAGGGTDVVARAVADASKNHFPQPVVVVNKTGAGGAVGMGEGANAKADGYTVTMITVELTTLPPQGLAPFTNADFKPIMQINAEPAAITVKADAPWNTVEEFLAYSKENEGQVKVGNSGVGAIWHLAAAAIETKTGAKFNHIPYEGAAPAIAALLGGHIDAVTVSPAEVASQVKGGQLKILGVVADERSKNFPDVPTLKEKGYDVAVGTWRGLAVPKDTPDDIVKILSEGFTKAVNEDAFKSFMETNGLTIAVLDSAQYTEKIENDNKLFKELIDQIK